MLNLLKKENFDIIHLHSSKAGFLGRVEARICNQQNTVLYTTHGISFLRKDISNKKLQLYIFLEKNRGFMWWKNNSLFKIRSRFYSK